MVEPWLRGTLSEVEPVQRQVLHALQLTREDAARWCAELSAEAMNLRPFGAAAVAFHLRHIARSLDRLLTYAEGRPLCEAQMALLGSEAEAGAETAKVMAELERGLTDAETRVLKIGPEMFRERRAVGRERLETTAGGLLVHCAEHTQRHTGQAITTARVVSALLDGVK